MQSLTNRVTPDARDLILVGGGHAHALVIARWAMAPPPGARVTLITPSPTTAYTGMLPGVIAGLYAPNALQIDLARLCRWAGVRLVLGRAEGLDPDGGGVALVGGRRVEGDVISLDVGAVAARRRFEDAAAISVEVKPAERFVAAWERFIVAVAEGRATARTAVIGAGAGGVELAFAMRARLAGLGVAEPSVALIGAEPEPAPTLGGQARRLLARRLDEAGVRLELGAHATATSAHGVLLDSGRLIEADFVALAAGVAAPPWLAETSLALDPKGFVAVDAAFRSVSHETVFAAGDVATRLRDPRDKAGVFAVRAAPPLGRNLVRALQGRAPRAARLQRRYLKLLSTGDGHAIAERWGVALGGAGRLGAALWAWKDRIDRAFMEKLAPAPAPPPRTATPLGAVAGVAETLARPPLCAGCGGKIGRSALRDGLGASGGDDAAALDFGDPARPALVSVDQMRAFVEDPRLFAEITAHHAFGDILASGGRPRAGLVSATLPPMSPRLQARTLRDLVEGARAALTQLGAELVGGHSAEGEALSLSVTALGQAERGGAILAAGAEPGDRLWLTRPVGSGTLLAADMRLVARGTDLAALYETLRTPQSDAARALRDAGARAMTDVTGFGLLGALAAMLEDVDGRPRGDLAAEIELEAVAFFDGALDAATAGVRSSLYEENARAVAPLLGGPPRGARQALLADPQTAGGLLAALPRGVTVPSAIAWPIGAFVAPSPGRAAIRLLDA